MLQLQVTCCAMLEWQRGNYSAPQSDSMKVTVVGKNEIYNRENLVGPFSGHKLLGPRPSYPPSNTSLVAA